MTPLFKKLNFKEQPSILVLNAPDSFKTEMEQMAAFTKVETHAARLEHITFAMAFVSKLAEIEQSITVIFPKLQGDAILWFCYPKASSKRFSCEFNRDTGWAVLGQYELEGVRQVAIDEDWSALRFRKLDYIKTMTRRDSMRLSEMAKKK
jgi:hypothetical protein